MCKIEETSLRVAAYAILLAAERILLCRISKLVAHSEGLWTLPGGGIEFGEHPKEAAVREVFEETGLEISVGKVLEIDSFVSNRNGLRHHGIRIIYSGTLLSGELRSEVQGSTDLAQWFTLKEAAMLPLGSMAQKIIDRIARGDDCLI